MTKEEKAIYILTELSKADKRIMFPKKDIAQALDMAIQAIYTLTAISSICDTAEMIIEEQYGAVIPAGYVDVFELIKKKVRLWEEDLAEQNVGMCQQNVGEMSEQTDVAVDPYDMKYIRGGKPSYNSIKTELDVDLISRDYVLSKFKEQCDRCGKYKENNGVMCRCCELDDVIDYVEEAPSAKSTINPEETKLKLISADGDLISRQAVIDLCGKTEYLEPYHEIYPNGSQARGYDTLKMINYTKLLKLPSIQPSGDLISRTDLLNKIFQQAEGRDYYGHNILNLPYIDLIESMPSTEKTAEWIDDMSLGYHISICSNCNWRGHGDTHLIYKTKYCPNCGAIMKEVE